MSLSRHRGRIVLLMDVCLIFACNFILFLPNLIQNDIKLLNLVLHIGLLTVCVLVFQLAFKTYNSLWRYAESWEYFVLLAGMSLGFTLYAVVNLLLDTNRVWITQAMTGTSLALLAMLGIRFVYRIYRRKSTGRRGKGRRYVAILGAGTAGVTLLKELKNNPEGSYIPYCMVDGAPYTTQMREVQVEDLLGRQTVRLDNPRIAEFIRGRTVLVTGGGGSIGSELCRQIAGYQPRRLVIMDIAENSTYELQNDLLHLHGKDFPLSVEIASIRDRRKVDRIFEYYRPEIVFHAAAHKHVPLMESCPEEAVKNNVFGTYNTAVAARKYGAEKFVLISTDKAVNPTNIMGTTKYLCEQVLQGLRGRGKTEFAAVRFGNVLGSSGSVIPLFKKQIAYGGPVTITDKRIIRYFMTIPEAVQLVLEAGSFAHSGEVFVLDMGEPVHILDLAEKLIRLSGYVPYVDIQIQEIGLRPGEKLYEELLTQSANLRRTENQKIFVEERPPVEESELKGWLEELAAVVESGSREEIFRELHALVPTFREPEEVNQAAIAAVQAAETVQLADLAAV